MLISYHIKAELCTLFDKVHKAFINSANAPSLYTFYRLPTVKPPPIQRRSRWRRDCARSERGQWPPSAAGGAGVSRRRQEGAKTPSGFLIPLLTPQTLLRTRLPAVARLNARGPQGRLVLQGITLDRSGAFRSAKQTPCTVWPRTVMRGKSRKVNSGSKSVP